MAVAVAVAGGEAGKVPVAPRSWSRQWRDRWPQKLARVDQTPTELTWKTPTELTELLRSYARGAEMASDVRGCSKRAVGKVLLEEKEEKQGQEEYRTGSCKQELAREVRG